MKFLLSILLAGVMAGYVFSQQKPEDAIGLNPGEMIYKPGMPKTEIALLEGNPADSSMFTIRLKLEPGFTLNPHFHPANERVTVLEGSVLVGFGDVVDIENSKRMTPGSFYLNPADEVHFIYTDEGAVIQITGVGPWQVLYP